MALSGKHLENSKTSKVKQVSDFKVRALDFLAIYIKEAKGKSQELDYLKLIKGLIKGL